MHIDSYDIVGDTFSKLHVVREVQGKSRDRFFLCRCSCGNEKVVRGDRLRNGVTKSCGCLIAERARQRGTHHMTNSSEYSIWCGMKRRTQAPQHWNFKYYGGRGITMCAQWRDSFATFIADVGPRPSAEHSLHRICDDLGYQPGNVKWADRTEQANNKRNNRLLTMNGKTHTLAEWARITGHPYKRLQSRLDKGWSTQDTLTKPFVKHTDRGLVRRAR